MKKLHNYYIKEAKRKKGRRWEDKKKDLATTYSPTDELQYHWRRSVSRSCSGWERVFPLLYGHQENHHQPYRSNAEMRCFRIETIIWSSLTAY